MSTSQAQREAVARHNSKLKRDGYVKTTVSMTPEVVNALEHLRTNKRGGFNLTAAVQQLILDAAAEEGYIPDDGE
jgi:hypothetical protein